MAASSTGSTENRQIFREFFDEVRGPRYRPPHLNSISDERIDEIFDGTTLSCVSELDAHQKYHCKAVAKKVNGAWHLFIGCIQTTYSKTEHAGDITSIDLTGYDFYRENEKVIYKTLSQSFVGREDNPAIPTSKRELRKDTVLPFLRGMEKHDPQLENNAANPEIQGDKAIDEQFKEFFKDAPELIFEDREYKALRRDLISSRGSTGWAAGTKVLLFAIPLVVLLGLAVAWKKGCFPFRSVKPLEIN